STRLQLSTREAIETSRRESHRRTRGKNYGVGAERDRYTTRVEPSIGRWSAIRREGTRVSLFAPQNFPKLRQSTRVAAQSRDREQFRLYRVEGFFEVHSLRSPRGVVTVPPKYLEVFCNFCAWRQTYHFESDLQPEKHARELLREHIAT